MREETILVARSSLPPYEEYIERIRPLWDSHWLTNMGTYHRELERELRRFLDVPGLSLFTNGHLALELAIQAMGLSGEVITTPFTFISTTHAIVRNGLTPVFCDIRPDNYTMDAAGIEELITERTSAIVPVHVYGQLCDVEAIGRLAEKYRLKVIYDAAHAFGETYRGKSAAACGDASILSFHATKVFHTVEGGAVVYRDRQYGEELYRLKNFGIRDEFLIDGVGANAKMDELRAIMGLCNLRYAEQERLKRAHVVRRYRDNLKDIPGLRLLKPQEGVKENYAYFPVVFEPEILGYGRDEAYAWLRERRIHARKYFFPLTCDAECYRGRFDSARVPAARRIAETVLALPLYADLPDEAVDEICEIVTRERRGL